MAYPVDDSGNIRVDFVWGNVPMQPDEQRGNSYDDNEYTVEGGWATKSLVGNQSLATGWTELVRRNGDQSDDGNVRYDIVEYGAHDIITTGYNNYPAFRPNYAGDGDTGLEAIMPNLVGLGSDAFVAALQAAGFSGVTGTTARYTGSNVANEGKVFSQTPAAGANVNITTTPELVRYVRPLVPSVVDFDSVAAAEIYLEGEGLVLGTVTTSTDGATAENDGWVKSQSLTPGIRVDGGTVINLVEYDYVAPVTPSTTGPIAGFNRASGTSFSLNGDDAIMYLIGRTVRPAAGDTITVSGTSGTKWNQTWNVVAVENNDSYNTGGTAVKVTAVDDISFATPDTTSTGGTWTKI